jgi:hypothetical protein
MKDTKATESKVPLLLVNAVGTKVSIGGEDRIAGIIVGISVRGESHITYEVGWWDGREYKSAWMLPQELTIETAVELAIGFR